MKRFLATILIVLMLVGCFSSISFAATTISLRTEPAVFFGGSIYNITWITSGVSIGYVEYTYNGSTHRVYDEYGGIVRTDDQIHSVSVPKEHLDAAGKYTIYSKAVSSRTGYAVTYGNTISSSYNFYGYQGNGNSRYSDGINAHVFSDVHSLNYNTMLSAQTNLGTEADFIVFVGDIIDNSIYKLNPAPITSTNAQNVQYYPSLEYLLTLSAKLSKSSIPVAYARGNHECRDFYSAYLGRYLAADTGGLYYKLEYGPVSGVITDFAEDKVDSHKEYYGVLNMENYHANQTKWLNNNGGYSENATYRFAVCHNQDTLTNHLGFNWEYPLAKYGTDLLLSGHIHKLGIRHNPSVDSFVYKNNSDSYKAPIIEDGFTGVIDETDTVNANAFPSYVAGVHFAEYKHHMSSNLNFNNNVITTSCASDIRKYNYGFQVKTGMNTPEKMEGAPDPVYSQNLHTDYYPGNYDEADDASFGLITKPVVFDTGDGNYSIVWASTEGTSALSQVRVYKNGTVYKFTDDVTGNLRILSNTAEQLKNTEATVKGNKNIHSVKVPKNYLDGSEYEVISMHIQTLGYTASQEYGTEVSSGKIKFTGYQSGQDINMLVLSQWENADTMVTKAKDLAKTADAVILGGNVADGFQTTTDFKNFIEDIGSLTSGKKPVYFTRGINETTGAFAPYVMDNIQFANNRFFGKATFGPVSVYMLDTPALATDTAYNYLADFEGVRIDQLSWLKAQQNDQNEYTVVVSNAPALYSHFGYDYNKALNSLGADLAVFSRGKTSFTAKDYRAQGYATCTNGGYGDDGTIGTMLTFKDGQITVKAHNTAGTTNTVSSQNVQTVFEDVSDTAWYGDAVSYANTQRLMVGTSATTFAPTQTLTRAQAAVILAKLGNADLSNAGETPFTDVKEDSYYAASVAWCYNNGITSGTSHTTFSPDMQVSREMLCQFIYNMYETQFDSADSCEFIDKNEISSWAKDAVFALAKAGVVSGVGNGKFMPKQAIDRASVAQILKNAEL